MPPRQFAVRLPPTVYAAMERVAAERGLSKNACVRQALGVLEAMHNAAKLGRYVGSTPHRDALEQVIVGPL